MLHQLFGRSDGSRDEFAAAVRATPSQRRLCTVSTESAFEAADHGIRDIGRQILVAALAIGSKL